MASTNAAHVLRTHDDIRDRKGPGRQCVACMSTVRLLPCEPWPEACYAVQRRHLISDDKALLCSKLHDCGCRQSQKVRCFRSPAHFQDSITSAATQLLITIASQQRVRHAISFCHSAHMLQHIMRSVSL